MAMRDLDWSLIRSFLAVAETGSLSAAARRLGLSQPTLGRQVRAAEAALGTPLFTRAARGLVPTEAGAALIGPARTKMLLLGGAKLTAAEAHDFGLVDRVVTRDALEDEIAHLAADAEAGDPEVLKGIKALCAPD